MLVAQSSPTLCDPVDCSSPGSSIHGISQTRIMEWVAIWIIKNKVREREKERERERGHGECWRNWRKSIISKEKGVGEREARNEAETWGHTSFIACWSIEGFRHYSQGSGESWKTAKPMSDQPRSPGCSRGMGQKGITPLFLQSSVRLISFLPYRAEVRITQGNKFLE